MIIDRFISLHTANYTEKMSAAQIRKSGIDIIGNVPWGTHFCQFYQTKQDLIDTLVPYFVAGLKNNEFCMWITSKPLSKEEAREALIEVVPDFEEYVKKGQIEIAPYTEWYLKNDVFDHERVLNGWLEKLSHALERGYDGLRLTGNTFWLENYLWKDFSDYEQEVNKVIGNYKMLAICTYSLDKCGANEIVDVLSTHQFALIKREGAWRIIESSDLEKTKQALHVEIAERKQAEELSRKLNNINELVHSTLNFDTIMKSVVSEAAKTLGSDSAAISLRTADGWVVSYAHGFTEDVIGMRMNDQQEMHAMLAIETKKTIVIPDAFNDERVNRDHMKKWGIRSVMVVPLTAGSDAIGVLFFNYHNLFAFQESHVDFANNLGASVSLAIQNALLFGKMNSEIAERRRAEELIKESEEKYRGLFDSAGDAVITIDPDDRITAWNKSAERIFGYTYEETMGKRPAELIIPEDKIAEMDKITSDAIAGKNIAGLETTGLHKDGSRIDVSLTISPIRNAEGEIAGLSGIVRDITERKRMEEALKESEEKYRGLFDSAGDAVITIDLDDRITSWNKSAERIFGWTAEEVVGKKFPELTVPEDKLAERDKIVSDALVGMNITGIETTRLRKDGNRIDVSLTFSPIRNAEGEITGLSGILRDITERKAAEQERLRYTEEIMEQSLRAENLAANIKKERNTLQIIMENTDTQLAYLDTNFNFIRVNSAYAKGSGHSKEELIGRNHFELFPNPENQEIFKRVRDSGDAAEFKAKPFEYIDQPWRGTTYWDWTLTPVKDASGKVERLVLSLTDVTERVLNEQAMKRALTHAESIIDTIPEPLLILDANLQVKTANHAFYKMFRVSMEETRDRLLYDLGNRQWDIPRLKELFEEIIPKNSHILNFEVKHEFPKIGRKTMLLNARKFRQDGAEMILLAIEDITERKNIEEIRLENERLISANKARSEILSIMSHELRTPLTSVIGYSILLKDQEFGKLNKKQAFYVDSVLANSRHLLSLINSTLDLAKIEAGKHELVLENVSVPDIVNESMNLIKEKAKVQHITLKKKLDPALRFIRADSQKFRQILFNLLSNALKFSKEEGGTITVSTEKRGNMAGISVSDTGIGIKEEDIPKLFQKFQQLDSGITRKYGGTGLGLAITKQLVEMHGGEITVKSRYGEGSTFTFLLPIGK